jgi:hypothetical protein
MIFDLSFFEGIPNSHRELITGSGEVFRDVTRFRTAGAPKAPTPIALRNKERALGASESSELSVERPELMKEDGALYRRTRFCQ